MPASKPKVRQDLSLVLLDEEGVVFDPITNLLHYLNPTAALVFRLCDGTATAKETVQELALVYDVEPQELDAEVRKLVSQYQKLGLVEPSRAADRLRAAAEEHARHHDERSAVRREVPHSD